MNGRRRFVRLLLRRVWVVPLAAACVAAVAVLANHRFPRPYSAQSMVVVPAFDASAPHTGTSKYADEADKLAVTYAALIPEDPTIRRAVGRAAGYTPAQAGARISVGNPPSTALLALGFSASPKRRAVRGAEALRTAVLHSSSTAIPRKSVLAVRGVHVTSGPRSRKSALAVGIVLGLVLGLVLMVAWERFDARIDDIEALREEGNRPATPLGAIPSSPILLERWRQLAGTAWPRVALLPLGKSAERRAMQLADVLAASPNEPGAFEFVVEAPILGGRSREVPTLPADLFVLVVKKGTRARKLHAALGALSEVGAAPDWLVLATRRSLKGGSLRSEPSAAAADPVEVR